MADGLQLYYSQSVGVLSVLSASVSSRLGTVNSVSHQITFISRPGNISLKYLDIWSQLECMAYQPLQRKKHPLIRTIRAQVHITFLGGIEKQYHSHLGKLNRNTLTELNRVISTGLFIKMLKIVFNWNIFLSVWGVLMIVTRKIYFAFNNKMFRSALQ